MGYIDIIKSRAKEPLEPKKVLIRFDNPGIEQQVQTKQDLSQPLIQEQAVESVDLNTKLDQDLKKSFDNPPIPLVFISHCHTDEPIARELIYMLEAAITLSPNEIRATSVPGYKLHAGGRVEIELLKEISNIGVVLGIITRSVTESPYVLFELGAAWGLGKPIYPLIAPDINPDRILGPIASVHRISLQNIPDCVQLVDDVCTAISRTKTIGADPRIADRAERLVKLVDSAKQ